MQTVTRILRTLLFVALSMAIVLPASGCGSKKKSKKKGGGLTIAQQLEKAKAEKTADKQAKAMVKVARQQLSSSDKSGAIATVTEARKLIAADGDPNLTGPGLVEVAGFMAELGEKNRLVRLWMLRKLQQEKSKMHCERLGFLHPLARFMEARKRVSRIQRQPAIRLPLQPRRPKASKSVFVQRHSVKWPLGTPAQGFQRSWRDGQRTRKKCDGTGRRQSEGRRASGCRSSARTTEE